jgi:hypothetical protein
MKKFTGKPNNAKLDDRRVARTEGVVEATSFENQYLWHERALYGIKHFVHDNPGFLQEVGTLKGKPICVDLGWERLVFDDGQETLVASWYPCSDVVDYSLAEDWIRTTFAGVPYADAQNFHNVVHAIRQKHGKS